MTNCTYHYFNTLQDGWIQKTVVCARHNTAAHGVLVEGKEIETAHSLTEALQLLCQEKQEQLNETQEAKNKGQY